MAEELAEFTTLSSLRRDPGSDLLDAQFADFSSLMPVGDKVYQITHFEGMPGASYLTTLKQSSTGELTVESTKCGSC